MLDFFKTKPLLSNEDTEFQIATFKWLLKNFGGSDFHDTTVLILPTEEFFPTKVETADEAAFETFNSVKKYAGLQNWPCLLIAQEEDIETRVAPTVSIQNAPTNPLGTFQATGSNEIVITYNPAIVNNPSLLVATYAHELAHYLTGSSLEEPPGGWDNWEFATDIAATFLGFGIFMTNSAFNFQQYADIDSQGWQYNRNGYLSEQEHIFALSIFLQLKGLPIELALKHLKPNLQKLLKKSMKQLSQTTIIQELLDVEYEPPTHTEALN